MLLIQRCRLPEFDRIGQHTLSKLEDGLDFQVVRLAVVGVDTEAANLGFEILQLISEHFLIDRLLVYKCVYQSLSSFLQFRDLSLAAGHQFAGVGLLAMPCMQDDFAKKSDKLRFHPKSIKEF